MVGLKARGEAAGESDGRAEAGDDADLARDGDEILHAHELRNRRGHFRHQAGGECGEELRSGVAGEEDVAEFADSEAGDGGEGSGVVGVEDEAGNLIGLVGDERLVEEGGEREIGEGHLRGHAFDGGSSGNAGELVSGAGGGGFGEQVAQTLEVIDDTVDGVPDRNGSASERIGG